MLGIKREDKAEQGSDWIGSAPWIQTSLPGPYASALIQRDQHYSSPSYTRSYPLVAKRGLGSVIEDVDGNRFLDCAAGLAVCATGHSHPKVVSAIEEQTRALIHVCGSYFYCAPMVELTERLAALAPGSQRKRVLLTNSGTGAAEAAFKLARYHSNRKWVIAFHGAFHGRTMGALSLSCSKATQRDRFGPLVPMVEHVPYGDVAAIEKQLSKHNKALRDVAAIFVEAVQGEGYTVSPPSFLPELRALCNEHGILLICDEIQSGIGRTGKWFAFEHFGIVPDMILVAKGLASGMPLGAVIAPAEIMDWPSGAQGSTFGGNPVCCAAALATLDLVESTYMANAARLGETLGNKLREIAKRHKAVANVRGLGLMHGVDIVSKTTGKPDFKRRQQVLYAAFERGLILLGCGECGIRFTPPLCISEAQLNVAIRIFDEAAASVE